MFRLLQHLLPRALAWDTGPAKSNRDGAVGKRLRQYVEGLAGLPGDVRAFVDLVLLDVWPETTRELAAWEKQFALNPGGTEVERRLKLAAAWALQGRQSPDYIQRALHAAGFTSVFIHEWWDPYGPPPPYVARSPLPHVRQPLIGLYQCEPSNQWQCFDRGLGEPLAPHCDDTSVNDPGYVVNLDLSRRAQPPVPTDPARWPYFLYFGAETFPERAGVAASRIAELKEILLRLCPAQQWIVLLVDPVDEVEGFGASEFGSAPFGA